MVREKYSIEAMDDCVIIYGTLTIEEAFDFISFYDKKGFTELGVGIENSTICLYRTDLQQKRISEESFARVQEKLEDNDKEQKLIISDLKKLIKDQQSVIIDLEQRYQIAMDNYKRDLDLNHKFRTLLRLRNDLNVKNILKEAGFDENDTELKEFLKNFEVEDGN